MQQLRGQEGLPDLRTAGLPATKAGSVHSCVLPLPQKAFLSGPEQAADWVKRRIDEGSDYIKIIADVPGPDQDVMNAISAEAHKQGSMVVAHAASYKPFTMALEAKVDVVTHVACDKAVDKDITDRMVASGTIAVPTLCMMKETTKKPSLSAAASLLLNPSALIAIVRSKSNAQGSADYSNARESVAAMHMAGVPILAGTDCHEEPNSMFDVKHGESMHRELELLVEAGLSPVEVLCAATSLPAKYFDLKDRGAIEEGKRADLVLLREDPTKDIRATRSISRVWCNGREVEL
ncbi:hypothetical protein LTR78_006729 [Recurvomyces mirabilis]|uniref:Amidohydrolase-related domain-containing protein n=1 Tax=Recurvomyces mirabilis TaxID=574656 RepID=A0AAE0WKR0_9PEZI|nr:hypothetical protein LTR78_006729 [Recurvomyces mirabilis]KAK5151381.1 hypothetical protein LTS14_009224 [Recurvomyces mirabilis]